jgi:osmotically-inducible protein OsmY
MPDPRPKEDIVPNDELRFDVEEELFWEPRVDNEAIAVSTDDAAWAAPGVRAVEDQIVIDYSP